MLALFKHAKNFCGDESRPLFHGILFDGKRAVATNTHLAVIVNNIPFSKKIIMNWKTGEEIKVKGPYPDIDKVIPDKTESNIEFIDLRTWIATLKVCMAVTGKYDYALVSIEGPKLITKAPESKFEATLPITKMDKLNQKITFNTKYLYDILMFFKDVGVTKVTLGINGPMAPMKLTTDKNVLAVLTPVRIPGN